MARTLLLLCLTLLTGCGCPHRFHVQADPDELPSFIVPKKIRVALVLGSGGVRGMAHVGVIEELEKAGVPIDLIVGCIAGSIVGALYADNPCAKDIYDTVWGMRSHTILDIELSNTIFGLSQGQAMMEILDEDLEARTFEELKIPLVVVATDLHTGELVPFGAGDLVTSVRASCSIPLVFEPCEYMGRVLVDGSVVNPVPAKIAHDLGAEIIIAVDLAELLDKTYPRNLLQVAERSAEIAFIWQNQECTRHANVVIRPKTCNVGCFNDKMKQLLYEAGKEATLKEMPKIKRLLEKHKVSNTENITLELREVTLPTYVPKVYY